jgi:hypothetical protein
MTSVPTSELDLYLALVGLLTKRALPEASMQVDCRTRASDVGCEYLVYASHAARPILAERLEKELRRALDVSCDEWVLSANEARTIAGLRLR